MDLWEEGRNVVGVGTQDTEGYKVGKDRAETASFSNLLAGVSPKKVDILQESKLPLPLNRGRIAEVRSVMVTKPCQRPNLQVNVNTM